MLEFPRNLIFIPVAMLFIAVLPLPYGYYWYLRVGMMFLTAWFVFIEVDRHKGMTGWAWIWLCVLVLFNPIIVVHLTRLIWFFFDLGTAALLIIYARGRSTTPPIAS